jgi:ribosomal protein S18 acetylase RimI-like enzyme
MSELRFTPFRSEDFAEYKRWYDDADLNAHLGPMDESWLQAVLHENNGREYAVFSGSELIAVVGIKFPTPEHPSHYITDFAIKPHLRSKGIGSQVLRALLKMYPHHTGWRSFVDAKNLRAQKFFRSNGWQEVSEEPDDHGMVELEHH